MTDELFRPRQIVVILTGLVYFLIIFAFAFAMGVGRALVVAPRLGETAAVLLEIPILVIASSFVARRITSDRFFTLGQLLSIAAIAFTLTMVSEALLADVIRGQSIPQWASALATPLGLVGLGGQLISAMMPTLRGGVGRIESD